MSCKASRHYCLGVSDYCIYNTTVLYPQYRTRLIYVTSPMQGSCMQGSCTRVLYKSVLSLFYKSRHASCLSCTRHVTRIQYRHTGHYRIGYRQRAWAYTSRIACAKLAGSSTHCFQPCQTQECDCCHCCDCCDRSARHSSLRLLSPRESKVGVVRRRKGREQGSGGERPTNLGMLGTRMNGRGRVGSQR